MPLRPPAPRTKMVRNGQGAKWTCQAGLRRHTARGGTTMSLFTWRERALAGGIVAGLVGAWAGPAVAQDKTTPPNFSWDLTVGWIGAGDFRPVPGKVPPVTNDPKYPFVPNG